MSVIRRIGIKVIKCETVNSTNDYISDAFNKGEVESGSVILASYQDNGRGQQESTWESEAGENILMSFTLGNLEGLPGIINKTFCLAVSDLVMRYVDSEVFIKWPNDIIHKRSKIAGLLIENSYRGSQFVSSTIGIGINVNQSKFRTYKLPATSLNMITARRYDIDQCFENLLEDLNYRYDQYINKKYDLLHGEYIKRLWGSNSKVKFRAGSTEFMAQIIGVDDYGSLILQNEFDQIKTFMNKEIEFIF